MFLDDVQSATSFQYSLLGERDNDWQLMETDELPYDFNTGMLSCRFMRKLVGSSKLDYTFLLNRPLEVRWTYGTWANDEETDAAAAIMSPKYVDEPRGRNDPVRYVRNMTLYAPIIFEETSRAVTIAASLLATTVALTVTLM